MGQKKANGFTLIELMIVVVIIGILASVAIPQFLKYQLKSKTTEASRMLGSLKTNQETFFTKYNAFGGAAMTPSTWLPATGHKKLAWTTTASGGEGFDILGFRPAGNVYYGYSAKAWADPTMTGTACVETHGVDNVTVGLVGSSVEVITGGISRSITGANGLKLLAIGNLDAPGPDLSCFLSGDQNWAILGVPAGSGESTF